MTERHLRSRRDDGVTKRCDTNSRCLARGALLFGLLAATTAAQTPLALVRVASGLDKPLYLTAPPGDEDRVFIVEKEGLIKILADGQVLAQPFLDLSARITTRLDSGLLGMAFHPNYANNGLFFVNFTRVADGATLVERFKVSADPNVADANSNTTVIGPITQLDNIHDGGCLQFGPDGYLYIAMGDGGPQRDPNCAAQDPQSLLGKMLRIDPGLVSGYTVPPTNPFVGNPAVLDEIWSLGWRSPWRFSFDRATGDKYICDVGYNTREEINFEPAGSSGRNYGWKIMEGETCFSSSNCVAGVPACNAPSLVKPIHLYGTGTDCAAISGYVYRGCAMPSLHGYYFFGDYCSGRVWSFRNQGGVLNNFTERTSELVAPFGQGRIHRISSFGEDARGELYIIDIWDGEVFKVVPGGPPTYTDLGFGKIGGNGEQPLLEVCGELAATSSADFILRRAPAGVPATLLVSTFNNPTPSIFGTIVPVPPALVVPFVTNPAGRVEFNITGGGFPLITLYAQYALLDPGAPAGIGLSNAIAAFWR